MTTSDPNMTSLPPPPLSQGMVGMTLQDLQEMADANSKAAGGEGSLEHALKNADRLTANFALHYQNHGRAATSVVPQYHHFVNARDEMVDQFRMKITDEKWAVVPVARTRFTRLGAICITNSAVRVMHRPATKIERAVELTQILLWSLGDESLEKAPIIRPGGFMFTEAQDNTVIMLRALAGAGTITAEINLYPG